MNLVIRDAFWQIFGRVISALAWFLVIKMITPYLWPLRYGDYSTVLKYFAIWSALADFGIYVVALNRLWKVKEEWKDKEIESDLYSKYVWARMFMVVVVYISAFLLAFLIPAYTSNPYILYWLVFGMLFSATFMSAGILQIPLQLYWKMKDVTIALVLARIVQVVLLVLWIYVFFSDVSFLHATSNSILAFLFILFSVLISWLTQLIYVWRRWRTFIKLKWNFDWQFTKDLLKSNLQYWFSYYLSSFHTLIVLIMLSFFFPTTHWYVFVGIWALALALIEILLIVPSALGNSMIHKIASRSVDEKRKSFWNFMLFVFWIWIAMLLNFILFSKDLIYIIWGTKYLTDIHLWSDFVLPFLAVVLLLSFLKQVFNYLFVSLQKQNYLLNINLFGVVIWTAVWLYLIPKYDIIWWVGTQLLLEVLFLWWACFVAFRKNIFPYLDLKQFSLYLVFFWVFLYGSLYLWIWWSLDFGLFVLQCLILNAIFVWVSWKWIRKTIRRLG